jgi:hypothetical protein
MIIILALECTSLLLESLLAALRISGIYSIPLWYILLYIRNPYQSAQKQKAETLGSKTKGFKTKRVIKLALIPPKGVWVR